MTKNRTDTLTQSQISNYTLKYESSMSKCSAPGFLASFLVDARGGVMLGRRHHGVDVIIPPGKVCQPTRLTCRMLKANKMTSLPDLSEDEAFVSRFIQVGPVNTNFIGPILIKVPHFACLTSVDREVIVLRSDDGKSWKHHVNSEPSDGFMTFVEQATKEQGCNDKKLVSSIITCHLPMFFVIISRAKQTSSCVEKSGSVLRTSTASVEIPANAVNLPTNVSLKVNPVENDWSYDGVQLKSSNVVSIEPRRRKFHTCVSVRVSVSTYLQNLINNHKKDTKHPVLLFYSMNSTGSEWEDVTELAPIQLVKDTVSFNTNVSARYVLIENHARAQEVLNKTYSSVVRTPVYACLHLLAKLESHSQWQIQVVSTDDTSIKDILENEESFKLIASTSYITLEHKGLYDVMISGDVHNITIPSFKHLCINTNRATVLVEAADVISKAKCVVTLVSVTGEKVGVLEGDLPQAPFHPSNEHSKWVESLQADWLPLAIQLGVKKEEIERLQRDYSNDKEQALVMLHEWKKEGGSKEELEAGLKMIGRNDIVVALVGGNNNNDNEKVRGDDGEDVKENNNVNDVNDDDDEMHGETNDVINDVTNDERNGDGSSVDEVQTKRIPDVVPQES